MPQEKKLIGVLSLRQKLADTRKKLQDYGDTIVSLRSELRTLRDGICVTCKRKFVPQNSKSKSRLVGPLSLANRRPQTQVLSEEGLSPQNHHAPESTANISEPITSKIPKYSFRNSPRSLRSKLSQSLPISSAPTRIPLPPPKVVASYENVPLIFNQQISSSKAILPKIEPSVPRWSVERDALDQTLEVSFVRALINKYGVNSVRFSPDGKYLAAGLGKFDLLGEDGAVVVYNVETGQQTCVLVNHSSQYFLQQRPNILCLSFSPDGRYLAAGDTNNHVTVWNIPNKRICSIFRGRSGTTESVIFSPNGRFLISVSWSGFMHLWKLRDGTTRSFSNAVNIQCARFSPDGKYIAAGRVDEMLMILDVRTGRMLKRWNSDGGRISYVAFTLDGMELLSGHEDGSVINWDIESSGRAVAIRTLKYEGLGKRIDAIALSPGARWVAAISDNKAAIWDTYNGIQQCTVIGYGAWVVSVDFSPSGKYLALGSRDGQVTVWKYVSSQCTNLFVI